jgi:hypothetical protein
MQRVHVDDLSGSYSESWDIQPALPAIAPETRAIPLAGGTVKIWREGEPLDANRLPPVLLEQARAEMGGFAFSAQYLLKPVPEEGEIIKWEWLPR